MYTTTTTDEKTSIEGIIANLASSIVQKVSYTPEYVQCKKKEPGVTSIGKYVGYDPHERGKLLMGDQQQGGVRLYASNCEVLMVFNFNENDNNVFLYWWENSCVDIYVEKMSMDMWEQLKDFKEYVLNYYLAIFFYYIHDYYIIVVEFLFLVQSYFGKLVLLRREYAE
jgi:hypothetical protein